MEKNGQGLLITPPRGKSDKKLALFKITQEFNSVSPNNCFRDSDLLRKYYDNLKEVIRKKAGQQRRSLYKTGVGPPSSIKKDNCDDLIFDIVNTKTIFGLTNPFDNDAVTGKQISIEESIKEPCTEPILESDTNSVLETFNGTGISTNQIEVVFVDQPSSSCATMNLNDAVSEGQVLNWTRTKSGDLGKVLNLCLQKNIEKTYNYSTPTNEIAKKRLNFSRHKPPVISLLAYPTLAEKYDILLDKKLS
ncbi:hypothetical protein FQA39_LY18074 [Lamprigera yunnana]|nr:hypothetical protein FQA39_LY18074 [Lamprigera yunnana]